MDLWRVRFWFLMAVSAFLFFSFLKCFIYTFIYKKKKRMISAVFALPQALRIKEELCFLLNLLYSSVPLRLLALHWP